MNQVEFLGLAHTFATTIKTFCGQPTQKRYGYSNGDKPIYTVVREVLCNNYRLILQSDWSLLHLGNKPKKFDFVHQTVSCREALAGGARDYFSIFCRLLQLRQAQQNSCLLVCPLIKAFFLIKRNQMLLVSIFLVVL